MTFISLLLLLAILGFFVLLLLKLGPLYLENYKVKGVLTGLESDTMLNAGSAGEVRSLVDRRLYINEVRRLTPKDIKVKREGNVVHVEISYEVREKIVGNVDAVVSFHDTAEIKVN
jgi:hypothetical protein